MLLLLQVVYVHIGSYAIEYAYSCQCDYTTSPWQRATTMT